MSVVNVRRLSLAAACSSTSHDTLTRQGASRHSLDRVQQTFYHLFPPDVAIFAVEVHIVQQLLERLARACGERIIDPRQFDPFTSVLAVVAVVEGAKKIRGFSSTLGEML